MQNFYLALAAVILTSAFANSAEFNLFVLNVENPDTSEKSAEKGVLPRELVRQAILIAARDGLGLSTRDMALNELFVEKTSGPRLDVQVSMLAGKKLAITVKTESVAGKESPVLFKKEFQLAKSAYADYVELAEILTGLSQREFPEMLRAAGYSGKPNEKSPAALPGKDTSALLQQMSGAAAFSVLRDAHATQRTVGESPATLAALARAYANLGLLSEHHWNLAHKSFKARSLLYAQRNVAEFASPEALYVRAYTLSLMGLHAAARTDLEVADKATEKTPAARPAWREVVVLDSRCDRPALDSLGRKGGPLSELALMLNLLAVGSPYNYKAQEHAAEALVKSSPHCFLGWDCYASKIGRDHEARALEALNNFVSIVPKLLSRMPDIPPELSAKLQQQNFSGKDCADAILALLHSAPQDMREPSWAVLGRHLQDSAFKQILLSAASLRGYNDIETRKQKYTSYLPLVEAHLDKELLDNLFIHPQQSRFLELAKARKDLAVSTSMGLFIANYLTGSQKEGGLYWAWQLSSARCDWTNRDLANLLVYGQPRAPLARELYYVSPCNSEAISVLLKEDNEFAMKHSAEIEENFALNAVVIAGLAAHYKRAGMEDRAFNCLKKCLASTQDYDAALALARMLPKNPLLLPEWIQIFDDYIKVEKEKYHRSKVCVEIVDSLLSRGEVESALRFGKIGADTGDGDAMRRYASALAAAGRTVESEAQYKAYYFNNVPDPTAWYLWCKRNDSAAAVDAEKALLAAADQESREQKVRLNYWAGFRLVRGDREKALSHFKTNCEQHGDPWAGLARLPYCYGLKG